jgi:hypothetical protein
VRKRVSLHFEYDVCIHVSLQTKSCVNVYVCIEVNRYICTQTKLIRSTSQTIKLWVHRPKQESPDVQGISVYLSTYLSTDPHNMCIHVLLQQIDQLEILDNYWIRTVYYTFSIQHCTTIPMYICTCLLHLID